MLTVIWRVSIMHRLCGWLCCVSLGLLTLHVLPSSTHSQFDFPLTESNTCWRCQSETGEHTHTLTSPHLLVHTFDNHR